MLTADEISGTTGYYWFRADSGCEWEIMKLKGTSVYTLGMEWNTHDHLDQYRSCQFIKAIVSDDSGLTE